MIFNLAITTAVLGLAASSTFAVAAHNNDPTVVIRDLGPRTNAEAITSGLPLLKPRSKASRTWSAAKRQASVRRVSSLLQFDDLPVASFGFVSEIPANYGGGGLSYPDFTYYIDGGYYGITMSSPPNGLYFYAPQLDLNTGEGMPTIIMTGSQIKLQSLTCASLSGVPGQIRIYGKNADSDPNNIYDFSFWVVMDCAGTTSEGGHVATYKSWEDLPAVDILAVGLHTGDPFEGVLDDIQVSYLV